MQIVRRFPKIPLICTNHLEKTMNILWHFFP